jgi:NADH:ubiquinone oxidoreductase subunit C
MPAPIKTDAGAIPAAVIADGLRQKLGAAAVKAQTTADGIPTFWIAREKAHGALSCLKAEFDQPYRMLYDLTAIDERMRNHPEGPPASDFTLVYHLLSFDRNQYVRIKVPLQRVCMHWPARQSVYENRCNPHIPPGDFDLLADNKILRLKHTTNDPEWLVLSSNA